MESPEEASKSSGASKNIRRIQIDKIRDQSTALHMDHTYRCVTPDSSAPSTSKMHQNKPDSKVAGPTSTTGATAAVITPSLRAQLHTELENRAKTCSYLPHRCSLPRVPNFEYCLQHILQDPRAPFKQCTFVYTSNGKRCPNPARIDPKDITCYCFDHNRHSQAIRTRTMGRWRPPITMESALSKLTHYVKPLIKQELGVTSGMGDMKALSMQEKLTVATDSKGKIIPLDPLTQINIAAVEKTHDILNYASESDSDEETSFYSSVHQGLTPFGSDDETVDPQNDYLKHAGIYTAEEANSIILDKLVRLQVLYIEQFKMLHQELKVKRAKHLSALRREQETLCSIKNQPKETAKEIKLYKKLKAYHRYQKKSGFEAILHERSNARKNRLMDGLPYKPYPSGGPRCIYTECGVKCTEKSLSCSKYCRKHILEDKRQVLFKACGVEIGGTTCKEPIMAILDIHTCPLHFKIPVPRSYNIRKESSDSENSDDDDNIAEHCTEVNENILKMEVANDINNELKLTSQMFTQNEFDVKSELTLT